MQALHWQLSESEGVLQRWGKRAEEGAGLGGPGCSALSSLLMPCSPLPSICGMDGVRKEQETY